MAYYNNQEDEDQQTQGTTAQTGPQSGVITGDGGSSSNAPVAKATNAPDHPGNFVGIQQYLNANKSQAAKLGDQTAGVINNSADQARQGVQALQTEAQQKVQATPSLGQDIMGKLSNGAENLSDAEKNQIKATQTAQYKGPQTEMDLNSYQNAADKTKTATQNIGNVGTDQGRMNLISQVNSKPRTQGINLFDNALLSAGGGREKLAQAAQANQGVNGQLDQATQAIRGQIGRADDPSTPDVDESQGAIGQTAKAQADAYKGVQDALSSWQSGFDPRVKQAQQQAIDLNNSITQDLGDNPYDLNQQTADLFGLQQNGITNTYGVNLGDYFKQADLGQFTPETIATPQDYARYAALSDLAGVQPSALDLSKSNLAGTAQLPGVDQAKVLADIKAAQNKYETNYSALDALRKKSWEDYNNPVDAEGNPIGLGSAAQDEYMRRAKGNEANLQDLISNYYRPVTIKGS